MEGTAAPPDAAPAGTSYWDLLRRAPRSHKLFIALACVQCFCIVLERVWLLSLTNLATEAQRREAVWFFVVVLVSIAFVLYFAVHGVLQTNAFEMVAFLLASMFLLLRLVLEFATNSEECGVAANRSTCLAFIVLACAFMAAAMAFSVKMYRDLQWTRYKAIGSAVDTRRMYRYFEAFSALRKLDVQFSLIVLVTGVSFFLSVSSVDLGPAAAPLSYTCVALFAVELVWERLGDIGVKRESVWHLVGFWALSWMLPAFIIAVIVETVTSGRLLALAVDNSVRWIVGVMAALALLNRAATVAATVVLYRNFGPSYVALRRIIEVDRKEAFSRSRSKRLSSNKAAAAGGGADGGAAAEDDAGDRGGAGGAASLARVEALAQQSSRAAAAAAPPQQQQQLSATSLASLDAARGVAGLGGAPSGAGSGGFVGKGRASGAVASTNPLAVLQSAAEVEPPGAAIDSGAVADWR